VLGTIDLLLIIFASFAPAVMAPPSIPLVFIELVFAIVCLVYLCVGACNHKGNYYLPYLIFLVSSSLCHRLFISQLLFQIIRFVIAAFVTAFLGLFGICVFFATISSRNPELDGGAVAWGVGVAFLCMLSIGYLALMINLVGPFHLPHCSLIVPSLSIIPGEQDYEVREVHAREQPLHLQILERRSGLQLRIWSAAAANANGLRLRLADDGEDDDCW
jgi:hypothetical protein